MLNFFLTSFTWKNVLPHCPMNQCCQYVFFIAGKRTSKSLSKFKTSLPSLQASQYRENLNLYIHLPTTSKKFQKDVFNLSLGTVFRGFPALQRLNIRAELSLKNLCGFCKLQRQLASAHYTERKQNHLCGEGKKIGRKQQTNPNKRSRGTRKPHRFQGPLFPACMI